MEKVGNLIKRRLEEVGMSKAEFARRIHKTRQNVDDMLTRDSFDTDLLRKISKVLEYNFFQHFIESKPEFASRTAVTEVYVKSSNMSVVVDLDGTEEGLNRWWKVLQSVNQIVNANLNN